MPALSLAEIVIRGFQTGSCGIAADDARGAACASTGAALASDWTAGSETRSDIEIGYQGCSNFLTIYRCLKILDLVIPKLKSRNLGTRANAYARHHASGRCIRVVAGLTRAAFARRRRPPAGCSAGRLRLSNPSEIRHARIYDLVKPRQYLKVKKVRVSAPPHDRWPLTSIAHDAEHRDPWQCTYGLGWYQEKLKIITIALGDHPEDETPRKKKLINKH
ncbi:hypothetical protein EVAR_25137_1 [Eumeta japonica]|uniref:Uncharacterized protein n=1 Tax=Eumeta variegata TaxID=151549 RepID=A0A4C1XJ92_EUMVA|nr:hypothetical protein EVAR_25137_1 [Eumeta japonica]